MPRVHSDHTPILINLYRPFNTPGPKMFKFEYLWLKHPRFLPFISSVYSEANNRHLNLLQSIPVFQREIHAWGIKWVGNIFHKKKGLLKNFERVQQDLVHSPSSFLFKLEWDLTQKYQILLEQEHEFWKIHSKINWMNFGDRNTPFF